MSGREIIEKQVAEISFLRTSIHLVTTFCMVTVLYSFGIRQPFPLLLLICLLSVLQIILFDRLVFSKRIHCPECKTSLMPQMPKSIKVRKFKFPKEIACCPYCQCSFTPEKPELICKANDL